MLGALLLTGCPREAPPPAANTEPRPSVTLRVVVVNEPELAKGINRLRGEWAERSGGELEVSARQWQEMAAGKTLDADLVVFPSRYLGELCLRDWLRPVRPNVLESEGLRADDFFPVVRHELIQWGGETMALPLGVKLAGAGQHPDGPPAITLLAEAASAAIAKERLGVLFDSETMKPRIAEPPFVDALARLMDSSNADELEPQTGNSSIPVLGYSDRLMAVTASSRNAASAFRLLEWLADPETSTQLARAARGTMPVRRSLASSSAWYDASVIASERAELGERLTAALSQRECLLVPRIPGVDQYMAALDQAVEDARSAGVAPQAALEKAAQRWEHITDSLGRDDQRRAYLKHLGADEP